MNTAMGFEIQRFATIRISSTKVSKSRDWYCQLLGVNPIEDTESFVSFKINGVFFDISLEDSKSLSSPGGSVGYWLVDNLDQAISKAIQLGGEIYRGPLRIEEVQRTIVQIMDPVGNVIGFEENF